MKITVLKEKLKDDFEKILEDETKLESLDVALGEIIEEIENTDAGEARNFGKELGNSEVKSWENFKNKMKAKYGY